MSMLLRDSGLELLAEGVGLAELASGLVFLVVER